MTWREFTIVCLAVIYTIFALGAWALSPRNERVRFHQSAGRVNSQFTEVSTGKCPTCKDQLLSIPGRTPDRPRRIICPICTVNQLEDLRAMSGGTVILSREEVERCSE